MNNRLKYSTKLDQPLTQLGLAMFAEWIESYDLSESYNCEEANDMVVGLFHEKLLYHKVNFLVG